MDEAVLVGERPRTPGGAAGELLELSVWRGLLRLSGPTTAVMGVAALSNILHTYFVSVLGPEAIAAVSLVFPVTLILTTLMAGGIGSGISSAVARALGAADEEMAREVAAHAFSLTLGVGSLASGLLFLGARPVFAAMGGKGQVLDLAVAFARVLYAGLLVTFFVSTCDSILRGAGNVRVPAVASTVSLVLQILLVPVFMFPLGFGIVGAALGTLVGQALGGFLRLPYLFGRSPVIRSGIRPRRFRWYPVQDILRVGIPSSVGTLAVYVGLIVLTAIVARMGDAHLAAFGLGSRLDFLVLTVSYGTGVAVLTLVGFAAGARRHDRIEAYTRGGALLLGLAWGALALLVVVRPELWLRMFTDDAEVLRVGELYLRTIAPTYPFGAAAMVFSFAFQGTGRAVPPLVVIVLRVVSVTAAAALATASFGASARTVFAIMALGNVASCLGVGLLFVRQSRRRGFSGESPRPFAKAKTG
ncbi:MAG: MATE family efflux transporter [Candidatus Binatia bacterium]|nr:MAG: MATE family efflux transporter [Candidatus Binatia bacterium]